MALASSFITDRLSASLRIRAMATLTCQPGTQLFAEWSKAILSDWIVRLAPCVFELTHCSNCRCILRFSGVVVAEGEPFLCIHPILFRERSGPVVSDPWGWKIEQLARLTTKSSSPRREFLKSASNAGQEAKPIPVDSITLSITSDPTFHTFWLAPFRRAAESADIFKWTGCQSFNWVTMPRRAFAVHEGTSMPAPCFELTAVQFRTADAMKDKRELDCCVPIKIMKPPIRSRRSSIEFLGNIPGERLRRSFSVQLRERLRQFVCRLSEDKTASLLLCDVTLKRGVTTATLDSKRRK